MEKSAAPQISWEFSRTGTKYGVSYGNVMIVVDDARHLIHEGASGALKEGAVHNTPAEAVSSCSVGWVDVYDYFYATLSSDGVQVYFSTDLEDGPSPYKLITTIPY